MRVNVYKYDEENKIATSHVTSGRSNGLGIISWDEPLELEEGVSYLVTTGNKNEDNHNETSSQIR